MVTMLSDPELLAARQGLPPLAAPKAERLASGWLALRHCRLDGGILPLILLHPAQGVAIIGGPVEGPALLRTRLAAGRFAAIFPGHLPVLRLDHAADPGPAFTALPPLTLPGGDAWVGVVRRALETMPEPPPPVLRRSWARHRRMRRRLWGLGGLAGLAGLAAMGWVASLPPSTFRPASLAQLTLPEDPVTLPAPALPGDAWLADRAGPGGLAMAPPAAEPAAVPVAEAALPTAPDLGQAADGTPPPSLANADSDPAVLSATPPDAPEHAPSLEPVREASPVQHAASMPEPALPPASGPARPSLSEPLQAPAVPAAPVARSVQRDPLPDPAAIRPAAASAGLPGRCRAIIQRLQIGDMVADGDIRLLKRGCPG